MEVQGVDKVFCATEMPFTDESVDAFFMIDVLHHISDTRSFLREALRCLKPGGKVVMIEPANTLWARFIYTHFHHEGFEVKATGWQANAYRSTYQGACGARGEVLGRKRYALLRGFMDHISLEEAG